MVLFWNRKERDIPGGPVVKNPPANVGDMRSIPRPGRAIYHGAPESVCCDYWSLPALEPGLLDKRGHSN